MDLQQGSCIRLAPDALEPLGFEGLSPPSPPGRCGAADAAPAEHLYQVIGVDDRHNRCWVRRWPLARHGSPVFEISLQQVAATGHVHPPRKLQGA